MRNEIIQSVELRNARGEGCLRCATHLACDDHEDCVGSKRLACDSVEVWKLCSTHEVIVCRSMTSAADEGGQFVAELRLNVRAP